MPVVVDGNDIFQLYQCDHAENIEFIYINIKIIDLTNVVQGGTFAKTLKPIKINSMENQEILQMPRIGDMAPDFTAMTTTGMIRSPCE